MPEREGRDPSDEARPSRAERPSTPLRPCARARASRRSGQPPPHARTRHALASPPTLHHSATDLARGGEVGDEVGEWVGSRRRAAALAIALRVGAKGVGDQRAREGAGGARAESRGVGDPDTSDANTSGWGVYDPSGRRTSRLRESPDEPSPMSDLIRSSALGSEESPINSSPPWPKKMSSDAMGRARCLRARGGCWSGCGRGESRAGAGRSRVTGRGPPVVAPVRPRF